MEALINECYIRDSVNMDEQSKKHRDKRIIKDSIATLTTVVLNLQNPLELPM